MSQQSSVPFVPAPLISTPCPSIFRTLSRGRQGTQEMNGVLQSRALSKREHAIKESDLEHEQKRFSSSIHQFSVPRIERENRGC